MGHPRPNILDEIHVLLLSSNPTITGFFFYDPALLRGLGFLGHLGEVNDGVCIVNGGNPYSGHEA